MISLETPPPQAPAPVPCVGRGGLLRVTFAFLQNPAEPGAASRGNGSPRPWKKLFCRITHTHTTGICPLPGLAPNPFPQPLTGSSGASGGPVWFLQAPSSRSLLREPPRGPCPGTSGCFCWGGAVASGHGGAAGGVPGDGRAWLGTIPTSTAVTFSSSVSRPGLTAQLYFGRHSSVFTGTPFKPGVLLGRATLQLCTVLPRGTHPPCHWGHKEWPRRGPWGARCPLGATGARCHQERHSPVFGDRGHPALTSPRRGQQDRGSATPLPCLGGHRGHQHCPHGATSGCPPPRWLTGVIVARRRWTSEPTRTMSRAWKSPWCLRLPLPPP